MSVLPPDHDLDLIHTRTYETRVYRVGDGLVARGAVCDTKPPGLYIVDDHAATIDIHRMVLELLVCLPELTITAVSLVFEEYPTTSCPSIVDAHQRLVGVDITRGFSRRVRELFGGPRGCTHVVALLLAMAPAIVQSTWSLSVLERRRRIDAGEPVDEPGSSRFHASVDTCHVWADGGEHVAIIRRGERPEPPLPVSRRLTELGRDPSEWRDL